MVLADYDVERARLVQARLGGGPADAPATARFPVAFVDAGKPELVDAAGPRARGRHRRQRRRPALRARRSSTAPSPPASTTWTWRSASPSRTRPSPFTTPGRQARRLPVPEARGVEGRGPPGDPGPGDGPRPDRPVRGLRPQAPLRRDRRGPRPRRRRPLHRGLRLRHRLQHLDDDRGVPQPAAHLGRGARRPLHDRAVLRLRRPSSSRRGSARSSASTSSTRRSSSSRAASPSVKKATFKYALGADFINILKVLHAVGLDSTKPITVKGVAGRPARRRHGPHARPGQGRRADEGPGDRRDLGHRPQGRRAARGLPLPEDRRRGVAGRTSGSRPSATRPASTRSSASSCWPAASGAAPASTSPRSSIPTRTWRRWTAGASTGRSRSASPGRASRPDPSGTGARDGGTRGACRGGRPIRHARRTRARRHAGASAVVIAACGEDLARPARREVPSPGSPWTPFAQAGELMERFIDVPGGRLFVVDEGGGPPVVLLHAGIVDLRAWDAFVPHLVAGGYRAVRYDARGWGRSTTEEVDYSNRADLVAVLDALGIGRAALVGNSRGGQIAFDTAVEFPDRVVAVVGVGAGLGGFEGQATPEELALFEEDGTARGGRAEGCRGDHRPRHAGLGRRPGQPAGPGGGLDRRPRPRGQAPALRARARVRPARSSWTRRRRPAWRPSLPGARRGRRARRLGRGRDGTAPGGRCAERAGRDPARRRPHDRDGAPGRAGGAASPSSWSRSDPGADAAAAAEHRASLRRAAAVRSRSATRVPSPGRWARVRAVRAPRPGPVAGPERRRGRAHSRAASRHLDRALASRATAAATKPRVTSRMTRLDDGLLAALLDRGVSRRSFLKFSAAMAATLALPATLRAAHRRRRRRGTPAAPSSGCAARPARATRRPSCGPRTRRSPSCSSTSCRSSTTRRSWPPPGTARRALARRRDGAATRTGTSPSWRARIPTAEDGVYCMVGGRAVRATSCARSATARSATIAVGSCAFDGGAPAAAGGPTGAVGRRPRSSSDGRLVALPGCPLNVDNLAATIVHYLTFKELPPTDGRGRPLLRLRRPDPQPVRAARPLRVRRVRARRGATRAPRRAGASTRWAARAPRRSPTARPPATPSGTSWPVRAGHGCIGCTMPDFWDAMSPAYARLPAPVPFLPERHASTRSGQLLVGGVAAVTVVHGGASYVRSSGARARRRAARRPPRRSPDAVGRGRDRGAGPGPGSGRGRDAGRAAAPVDAAPWRRPRRWSPPHRPRHRRRPVDAEAPAASAAGAAGRTPTPVRGASADRRPDAAAAEVR